MSIADLFARNNTGTNKYRYTPRQVDETVASIKAVPVKAQAAAKEKADDLVTYIKNIPDTIAKAAKVCCSCRWW